jgi:multicomponent Na+:H+ antiporter subunit D
MDWFYRKGGRVFFWLARKPIQTFDTWFGEVYRNVGLYPLMTTAKFWSWFDWHGIDGFVDGLARLVRSVGTKLRTVQNGRLQYNIYYAVSIVALLIVAYVFG